MTFDNDFVQIDFGFGTERMTCKSLGIEWPPPERITVAGQEFERITMSALTDQDRAEIEFVVRGARYEPAPRFGMTKAEEAAQAVIRG